MTPEPTATTDPRALPGPDAATLDRLRPRALHRAEEGRTLKADEVAALLTATGEDLARLCAVAAGVRDRAPWYADGGWGRTPDGTPTVTYSRKVFVPLTHLCRDTCGYCTFAWPPKGDVPAFMSPEQVLDVARQGQAAGCTEVLFTLGDKPEERYPAARAWLDARGYDSTLGYLRAVSIQVIEETGLLPHLNPGVMCWTDMATLKPVAASMGMMLESTVARLLAKGQAHFNSPDKDPAVRLKVLEDAGRLSIPFTSGIADRHRRDAAGARRHPAGAARVAPPVRAPAGGDRPELPGQARHGDARPRRAVLRDVVGGGGHRAGGAGPDGARPGAAEPVAGAVRDDPGCRDRRLGRGVAGHARTTSTPSCRGRSWTGWRT